MSRRKNHTDAYFRRRLKDYRASPPEGIWTGISSALNREKRKQRILVFRRVAASVAVLLSLGVAFLLLRQGPDNRTGEAEMSADSGKQVPEISVPLTAQEPVEGREEGPGETRRNTELAGVVRPAVTVQEAGPGQDTGPADVVPASVPPETSPLSYIRGIEADLPVHIGPETRQPVAQTRSRIAEIRADEEIETFGDLKEEDIKSYDKWVIGTRVSPLYSYRSIGAAGDRTVDYINRAEGALIAYAGGVNVNFLPLKRLALQSGLYYSRMGLKVKDALYVTPGVYGSSTIMETAGSFMTSNSSGMIPLMYSQQSINWQGFSGLGKANGSPPADGGIVIQQFDFLELPVIVRYRLMDRKIGLNILGGLSTNFLVGRNAYLQQDGEKKFLGLTEDLKTVSYSSILGIGLDFTITSNLDFNIEPMFRYYMNSINRLSTLKSHPYSIGFYTGISYSF